MQHIASQWKEELQFGWKGFLFPWREAIVCSKWLLGVACENTMHAKMLPGHVSEATVRSNQVTSIETI